MAENVKLVLWSREGCQACQEAKAYLKEKGYVYSNVDVGGKDYLRDVLEVKYGIRHVPVIEVGRNQTYEAIVDSDFNRLEALLKS
ncbi:MULTISPECIES: glutaredoxin family protein [Paenibacillus]|uniref:Glutaredoxin n=1 Tax=Paenibacillus naphthalenovorans TaxID=162209 RepID=A0A0U2U6F1_9BACL|nr:MULTISPECIES: glutaredoxin family protein [Paenibacillus]ALS21784.1 glutaredoxin [Paenibacillus naphthalenovorans]NTZ16522.1 glutaredoxin family protein [Paenibacillus sp. JMULE4]GCL71513.1 glutaredoxin family protein [Paenibacillus naphthalenovorans]SDI82840.1 Glutaredoxin [Paenibacillus naphthalenovorans]